MICDGQGLPLVVWTTPANVPDSTATPEGLLELEVQADAVPPLREPLDGPKVLLGDRGYGFLWLIDLVRSLGWVSLLSRRGSDQPHGSGLGVIRYVVERTLSWFNHFRRLRQCNERWGEHFQAFHDLAATIICHQRLAKPREGL